MKRKSSPRKPIRKRVQTARPVSSRKAVAPRRTGAKKTAPATRAKTFVSHAYPEDRVLKGFLIGQTRNPRSPIAVSDYSMKKAAPNSKWKSVARKQIARVDQVVVLRGKQTHRATGVKAEVAIARSLGKPVVQLVANRDAGSKPVANAGPTYRWTQKNLTRVFKARRAGR